MRLAYTHTRIPAYALLAAALLLVHPRAVTAQGGLTQDEALRLAFPAPMQIERRTAYLDAAQTASAAKLAGADVTQRVITYYLGVRADAPVGVAYFDGHRVRTLGEVLMIVVGADHAVQRIEVLKFLEPHDYRAPRSWLDQFNGRRLAQDMSLKRGIVNMTGATLTATAVTNAARRVLALHAMIQPFKVSP